MHSYNQPKQRFRPIGAWWCALLFLDLVLVWNAVLTLVFIVLFDSFMHRLTHPFDSGWEKGPWGFVLIYGMLCMPVLPIYNRLERWIEMRRRRAFRKLG